MTTERRDERKADAGKGNGSHPVHGQGQSETHLYRSRQEATGREGLIVSDILHIFKFGYVYNEAEPATEPGHFKYLIDSPTPNSNGRVIRAVIIPLLGNALKIVTVMWVDEDGVSS